MAPRRMMRRRPTTRRYRRTSPRRRVLKGNSYANNPMQLLGLTRHYTGSSGARKGPGFVRYFDTPDNSGRRFGRFAAGVVGRNLRAAGTYFGLPGMDALGKFANYVGKKISPDQEYSNEKEYTPEGLRVYRNKIGPARYNTDSKLLNAGLSFLDGEYRKGSINTYTDAIGQSFLAASKIKNLDTKIPRYYDKIRSSQNFDDVVNNLYSPIQKGIDFAAQVKRNKYNTSRMPHLGDLKKLHTYANQQFNNAYDYLYPPKQIPLTPFAQNYKSPTIIDDMPWDDIPVETLDYNKNNTGFSPSELYTDDVSPEMQELFGLVLDQPNTGFTPGASPNPSPYKHPYPVVPKNRNRKSNLIPSPVPDNRFGKTKFSSFNSWDDDREFI